MAKKTNYLTELIERHERWRAEGGERHDDDDRGGHHDDAYVVHFVSVHVMLILSPGRRTSIQMRCGTLEPSDTLPPWAVRPLPRP
jgi:hypothetical protein